MISKLELTGDWEIEVQVRECGLRTRFTVQPTPAVSVVDEEYRDLPEFNPNAWGGWMKGVALRGVLAQECTTKGALIPESLRVAPNRGRDADILRRGVDYEAELDWGSVGRLATGRIAAGQTIFVSYDCVPQRLDSIVLTAGRKALALRSGTPHMSLPKPPALAPGETRLANLYLPAGQTQKLTEENLFPILEPAFPPGQAAAYAGTAARFLPKTLQALQSGKPLRVLAWGDSVTAGGFVADADRWQEQFVGRLRQRFPAADIELVTEAWGGRNTEIYLAEPPGSLHNYQEKVLAVKPDLAVIEFVNDAGLTTVQVNERYGRILADFRQLGTEVILLTPHYVRPDWMGFASQKNIDHDPREYVRALRAFAAVNGVALADGAERYGRLWRQGVPYLTLMANNINHPCREGMALFADSLMALFA